MSERAEPGELDAIEARLDGWARRELAENPALAAVERGPRAGGRIWHVRLLGEEKDTYTVRLVLRERTLHHESFVMPAPEENHAAFYEHLLRRNAGLRQLAFVIGEEDAVFLQGQVPVSLVEADELDRILGSYHAAVEQMFRPALRIGFASRFGG